MCSNKHFLVIISVIFCLICSNCAEEIDGSPEDLYHKGIEDHNDNEWSECIINLEASLSKHKRILLAIADCRIRCANQDDEYLNPQNIEDIYFYEKMIKRTLCFMKCRRINYPDVKFESAPDITALKEVANLDPYLYLQNCYYQERQYQKAASAAFTYLVRHPDDYLSKINLKYYLQLPEVDTREVTNFEAEEYYELYLNAVNSYNKEEWKKTVDYMEEALHAYFAAEDRCRVLCEGSFDQGWLPDFTASISNHFTYCLQCKQLCKNKLKTLDDLKGEELLADFYNYLQFAYHKLKNNLEAGRCAASYLLIHPTDEEMLANMNLYMINYDVPLEPRPETVYYTARNKYEKKLLKFIEDEFTAEMKVNDVESKKDTTNTFLEESTSTNNIINELEKINSKKNKKKSTLFNRNPFKKYMKEN